MVIFSDRAGAEKHTPHARIVTADCASAADPQSADLWHR